jgi:hypothetical protein
MLPDSLTSPDLRIVIKYQAARIPAIAEADEAFRLSGDWSLGYCGGPDRCGERR